MDFIVAADRRVKIKESEKRDKSLDLARQKKKKKKKSNKTMKHKSDGNTSCNWCVWKNSQRLDKETGRLKNQKASRAYPDDSIIKIGQNTEKSPGDLRRLVATQTPVKNHQLTMV